MPNERTIEPEIAEQMQITPIKVPEFKNVVTLEQLQRKGFSRAEAETLAILNRLEEYQKWSVERFLEGNGHMMRLEEEAIRSRLYRRQASMFNKGAKWVALSISAGLCAAYAKAFAEQTLALIASAFR